MTEQQDRLQLKGAQRPRTAARVAALQALFQIEQNEDRAEDVTQQFLLHRFGTTLNLDSYSEGYIPEADTRLFSSVVKQAVSHRSEIFELLSETLPATWPVARLDPVLRALFQAAIGEALDKDLPSGILINEYLDIAHAFFFGDEPKLVNGVLDSIVRRINQPEATDAPTSVADEAAPE